MVRRQVFRFAGIALACVALTETVFGEGAAKKDNKPNILFIMTDQQSAHMMSCAGDKWLKTLALLACSSTCGAAGQCHRPKTGTPARHVL